MLAKVCFLVLWSWDDECKTSMFQLYSLRHNQYAGCHLTTITEPRLWRIWHCIDRSSSRCAWQDVAIIRILENLYALLEDSLEIEEVGECQDHDAESRHILSIILHACRSRHGRYDARSEVVSLIRAMSLHSVHSQHVQWRCESGQSHSRVWPVHPMLFKFDW